MIAIDKIRNDQGLRSTIPREDRGDERAFGVFGVSRDVIVRIRHRDLRQTPNRNVMGRGCTREASRCSV